MRYQPHSGLTLDGSVDAITLVSPSDKVLQAEESGKRAADVAEANKRAPHSTDDGRTERCGFTRWLGSVLLQRCVQLALPPSVYRAYSVVTTSEQAGIDHAQSQGRF